MQDHELLRYSRQILLPQIDIIGQNKLAAATVMIIGLGGLGSPVAMYLAAAGVGHLILVDADQVELSNLQRQIVHSTANIGKDKVESASMCLTALNPLVKIMTVPQHFENPALFEDYLKQCTVLVDASDNFETRFTLNRVSQHYQIPLVSGAAVRFVGQVSVFNPKIPDSPCYHCLYPDEDEAAETCSQTGVLSPLLGVIGSIQATEVLKIITEIGETLCGRLLMFDAEALRWRTVNVLKDPACPVCASSQL